MEIYLVRHTTPDIASGICYGQSDLDVTDTFEAEASEVQRKLKSHGRMVDAVFYSSPLQRCFKLANSLSSAVIITDDRLMEMSFGDWEMQGWDDIDEKALRHWTDDFVNVACPGGESYQRFYDRVVNWIESVKLENHSKVVIVTHGGVIRSFLCYLGLTTLETSFEEKVEYGDVFKLDL
jgi:alpha-ribazole phosphatase